jgi:hypothetical protein
VGLKGEIQESPPQENRKITTENHKKLFPWVLQGTDQVQAKVHPIAGANLGSVVSA